MTDKNRVSEVTFNVSTIYEERCALSIQKYKFQSIKHLNKLNHSTIFMSDPGGFNDPFDLKLEIADDTMLGPFDNVENLRAAYRLLFEATPEIGSCQQRCRLKSCCLL